ncbi:MAG TPA: serine hydrolase domain-containing protein [Nitrospira sp.]|nr:serine hydrolase domain-containing protein [Nitrospira sp.]
MNEALIQRLRVYLEPPACRVSQAAVSIAFQDNDAIQSGIVTSAGGCSDAAITVESRFSVQSISKSFTAVVILRLVGSGKLMLDAPLSEWLPGAPNAARITIRQCLQHTSGLPDYGPLPEYHEAVRQGATPWTFEEFLTRTHAGQLLFEPGQGWRYSNIGYMLLRRLIETVCGQSFADVIAAEVCRPLGLRHTSVIRHREDFEALAPAYSFCVSSDGLPIDIRTRYDPGWVATGVVASTASDLVRFYDRLFAGDLLPGHLLDEMRTVVRASPTPSNQRFAEPSYGLGLIADLKSPYGVLYGHSGAGPGYTSAALHVVPARGRPVTVAVLSNTENFFEVELMAFTIVHALTR